jgi:hypothetical protein
VSLTHDEIRELLAAHALDAVDGAERDEIDAHLYQCETCRVEFDEHRAVAALIATRAVEADVPESLWSRVRTEISPLSAPAPLRRRTPFMLTVGTAAAMLVLVVVQTARLSTVQTELVAAESRLVTIEQAIAAGDLTEAARMAAESPGARSVALSGAGTATITLLADGTGFVTASDLDDLPAGRTYQLWIVQRGEAVSAGLLGGRAIGSIFRFDPTTLEGLVVTEEEAAGVVVSDGPAVAAWFDA